MSDLILKYIEKDPISFIHVRELLDRNYSIIFESTDGFIIHDDDVNFTYMSFSNFDVMKEQLSKNRYTHYISYNKDVVDYYNDNDSVIKLYQYVYDSKELFELDNHDIRVLTTDYAPLIDSFYKAIGPGETSIGALKRKEVLGIFEDNELAGIIGRHPEGCVGMLHVFEKYRGKGYAKALEKAIVNKLLKEKQRVFCEIVDGNEISLKMHNSLGWKKGDKALYWLV